MSAGEALSFYDVFLRTRAFGEVRWWLWRCGHAVVCPATCVRCVTVSTAWPRTGLQILLGYRAATDVVIVTNPVDKKAPRVWNHGDQVVVLTSSLNSNGPAPVLRDSERADEVQDILSARRLSQDHK